MASTRQHRTRLVHHKPKAGGEVRSEINVTPLVDVCLVLLIIFMVVLPRMSRGVQVDLPKTKNHFSKKDTGQQPILSVTRESGGKVVYNFDKENVRATADASAEQVLEKRAEEGLVKASKSGIRSIFVKADADLNWSDVYPALMALHEAGSEGVELGTTENKEAQ